MPRAFYNNIMGTLTIHVPLYSDYSYRFVSYIHISASIFTYIYQTNS